MKFFKSNSNKRGFRKKYSYDEYVVNCSVLKRAYQYYLHQTIFDKILDILIIFAIFLTILELAFDLFLPVPEIISEIIHSFSVFILTVFGLELLREYAISKHTREFLKKNWLDIFLVAFLSFYLLTAIYLNVGKFLELFRFGRLNEFLKETKHVRVLLKYFGFIEK